MLFRSSRDQWRNQYASFARRQALRSYSNRMVCSVCKKAGHNKRTCIVKKLDDSGIPDEYKDAIADHLAQGVSDELLAEALLTGADVMIPGLGMSIRLGRYAWKLMK